jgi:colanic acid biosynthesis glycosyl transferase WcaI
MKILFHDYGGYAFSQQMAKQLSHDHNVKYLYSANQLVQRCSDSSTATFDCAPVAVRRRLAKYNLANRYLWEQEYGQLLAREIRQEQPDVVISANTPLDSQQLMMQAAKSAHTRFVFWFQDAIGLAMENILRKKIPVMGGYLGKYYQGMEKRLLSQSDAVILISPGFYPLMDRWKIERKKTHLIANWAPLDEIPVLPKENEWSRQHGLDQSCNLIYSGILGYKHNPEMFIQLAEHFKGNTQVKVVVVSEGGGADWLREQQESLKLANLVLLPFQPSDEYPKVLASADVLISLINADASQYSIPSKVLSYFCAGKPVLLSMTLENEAAQTVLSAGAGLVSEPGDTDEWLDHADKLVASEVVRTQMGRNARAYAEKNFALEPIYEKFASILAAYE